MDGEKLRGLGDSIAATVAAIDRTEHQLMALLREFDAAGGWQTDGQTSFAAWLSYRTGMSPGAARERVRMAAALAEPTLIDEAFGRREISYSKARAMTRVATAENEDVLLTSARGMSAAELEKLCQMVRSVGTGNEPVEPERRFSQRAIGDGMIRMTVTVTTDEAAVVCAALDSFAEAPSRRAEGLVAMADECSRGPAEASRRLLCDAGVVPLLCDQACKTLDVGRKSRTIPASIRRALSVRDRGCRFPGCSHTIVDGHHIEHWINGGETKIANLVSLCRRHHRFVHEGGAAVESLKAGEFRFRTRDGELLAAVGKLPTATSLPTQCFDPLCAVPADDLRPIDWSLVVGAITG